MEYRSSEIKAGMFIFVSFLALVILIFLIGDLKNYFKSMKELQIIFNLADGLAVGAPVRYAGLEIGSVKDIDLLGSQDEPGKDRVSIFVDINPEINLKKDSLAVIKTAGLMGSLYIDIRPGSIKSPFLEKGEPLIGEDSFEFTKIGDILSEFVLQIKRITDVADTLAGVTTTTLKLFQRSLTDINQLIETNEDSIQQNFKNFLEISSEISQFLDNNKDELHQSIQNLSSFTNQADNILKEKRETISSILLRINNITHEVENLLADNQQSLSKTISNMETGTKEITTSIKSLSDNLGSTVDHGNSILLENRRNLFQLIKTLKEVSINLKELSDDLKLNPWKLIRKSDEKVFASDGDINKKLFQNKLRMKRLDKTEKR